MLCPIGPSVEENAWCVQCSAKCIHWLMFQEFLGIFGERDHSVLFSKHVVLFIYFRWFSCHKIYGSNRPTFTAEQSPQMWIRGKRPHHSCPLTWQSGFSFSPLWTLLLFACWLSLRGGGRSWLLTHYLFSTWVRNSCQEYFFFHITVSSTKTCYWIAPCHLK